MQGDVWGVWLSGAPVPPDSIEFYARQLAAHSIEPDHIHRLTPQQLVAIGFLAADAEQTVKKKKKKKKKNQFGTFCNVRRFRFGLHANSTVFRKNLIAF
jgi:hypothetical protein